MRRTSLIALGSLACIGLTGCPADQCTQSLLDPNQPSPALECAAGLLCYQGQCIKACSAGQEGAQACSDDGDCDGSRPNCIDEFCSACEEGEFCVPTQNICQPFSEVDLTVIEVPPIPPPGSPRPTTPLDAGWIDGGLRLDKDAGTEVPIDQVVTIAGLIDVANIYDYSDVGLENTSKVGVNVLYVGDVEVPGLVWRTDPWDDTLADGPYEAAAEMPLNEANTGDCVINYLQTASASIAVDPISIGDILIDSAPEFPGSMKTPLEIPFDDVFGEYDVPDTLPPDLLFYSELPDAPHFISISGGTSDSNTPWPNPPPDNGEHVPFRLVPSAETEMLLQNGATVTVDANGNVTADLVMRWDPIRAGSVTGEDVTVRFRGLDYEVNCRKPDGIMSDGAIVVRAGVLAAFRMRQNLLPNTTLPLYFERSFSRRTNIVPTEDEVIDVSIRVRHTLIGTLTFQ